MLARARRNVPQARFVELDATQLDSLHGPYGAAIAFFSGYLTDELRSVLRDARFSVEEESSISYAPASTEAGPEIQVFVNCRRLG